MADGPRHFDGGVHLHAKVNVEEFILIGNLDLSVALQQLDFMNVASLVLVRHKVSLHLLHVLRVGQILPILVKLTIIAVDVLHLDCPVAELPQDGAVQVAGEGGPLKDGLGQDDAKERQEGL